MTAEYPGATWAAIPGFGYPQGTHGQNKPKWIILHGTASGDGTAEQQVRYFQSTTDHGVHFVIGKDGKVFQMVRLADAAYGNCCIDPPKHDAFWDTALKSFNNLNLCTISIEHCKTHSDNSDQLTPAQQEASFQLVAWLCERLKIPARPADAGGGITGHYSMNGINRANCPGAYPWAALWSYLKGENMVPRGWTDDPVKEVLTAPNGIQLRTGMRNWVLNHAPWPPEDMPQAPTYRLDPISPALPGAGGGVRTDFLYESVGWTAAWNGERLLPVAKEVALLKHEIEQLKQQPPAPPSGPSKAEAAIAALAQALNLPS